MPQDPRTWTPGDYVSASYLDYDLYVAGGGYPQTSTFVPNGVRWHAQRALYKAVILGTQTLASGGTWKNLFTGTGTSAQVIADTAGLYGAHMDPSRVGTIEDVILSSGGGLPLTSGGGWYLLSGFVPIASTGAANNVAAGYSIGTGTPPSVYGTQQKAFPSSGAATPFVIDLIDSLASTYTLSASSNGSTTANLVVTSDGSGSTPSMSALWVATNSGSTTALPAPQQTWSGTSTVTSAGLNSTIQATLRNLNQPPMFRGMAGTSVNIPSSTNTSVGLSTVSVDTYAGYSSPTYTVQQAGLYLVHWMGMFGGFSGQCMAGVQVNGGTIYWGPAMPTPTSGWTSCTKTQIFSLNSGDTLTPMLWQNSGSTLGTNAGASRMIVLKVATAGVPSPLPNVPDTTYRYMAGYQPDLHTLFNNYLSNDLSFLTYKPYLMSYQTTTTTGISMLTPTKVIMNNAGGIIHSDNGDNYSGYSTSTGVYTVQRTGWYLACGEIFMSLPSLTTSPLYAFQMFPTPGSSVNPSDGYQSAFATTSTNVGGCTGLGYYHLRAGDTIYPGIYTANSSSTTTSTSAASGRDSHFEMVWVCE